MNSSVLGALSAFDPKTSSYTVFSERLTLFFIANEITSDDRKKAIFLTTLNEDCYVLLRNLCDPETPSQLKYDELNTLLSQHFSQVKSYFSERLKFYTAVKMPDEKIGDWEARVKVLAANCGFSANTSLDSLLRDVFTIGIRDQRISKRIFEEDASKSTVTLSTVVEIALAEESSLAEHSEGSLESNMENLQVTSGKEEILNPVTREYPAPSFRIQISQQSQQQGASKRLSKKARRKRNKVNKGESPTWGDQNVVKSMCGDDHCPGKDITLAGRKLFDDENVATSGASGGEATKPDLKYLSFSVPPVSPSLRGGDARRKDGPNVPRGDATYFAICIANLSDATTITDLRDLVKPFGPFRKLYLAKDKQTGLCKGFAYIHFNFKNDAAKAIAILNGYRYGHLFLAVDWF